MPLIRKKRIWWESVPGIGEYVIYASKRKIVFDPRNFKWEATPDIIYKVIGGKTELIIPDDWPEFPKEAGTFYVGITARDEVENESDPLISEGLFKFLPPMAPSKCGIESLSSFQGRD
jgi:hypothetical protein